MTAVAQLLETLIDEGATLWVEDGHVRFRAPAGVMTQERTAVIRANKDQAVAYLHEIGERQPRDEAPIFTLHGLTRAPLSTAQMRLWLVDKLSAAGVAYNVPASIRMTGALDVAALEGALRQVIVRHQSLRTRLVESSAGPQQIIDPAGEFSLKFVDLSAAQPNERAAQVQAWTQTIAFTPFHLEQDRLLRAVLLKLAPSTHLFLLCLHHAICDGWSMAVFVGELTALYQAQRERRDALLPALRAQYADYALWERARLTDRFLAPHVEYWHEQLAEAPASTELLADMPRPAAQSFKGAELPFEISQSTAETLHSLTRHEGTTLFVGLLAAFNVLLHRWTGQDDLVVGSPIAGRNHKLTEPLIGLFVNMLPIRTRIREGVTFRELLRDVAATTLAAYAHQDVPFERLLEAAGCPRDRARQPLFQTVIVCENMPQLSLQLPGLQIEEARVPAQTAKFDLTLFLRDSPNGITAYAEYATDLFERATIERFVAAFQAVLHVCAERPDVAVAEIDLITPPDRKLLATWNATEVDYPRTSTVHAVFEQQVDRHPDHIALVCGEQMLTYRELNARANRLAHYLRSRGVGPDTLVGVWCERGFELCTALLGILKAGGAYLPFDPSTPVERGRELVADARPLLMLTQQHLRSRMPAGDIDVFALDTQWSLLATYPTTNPDASAGGSGSEHLAYVIYTSGSTGKPKGVMIEHRNVLRLILNNHFAPLSTSDRIVNASNPAFDATTWEIWAGLLQGATVLIVAQTVLLDPELFANALREGGATALWMTVGLFNEYVDRLDGVFAQLRYLLIGGDALEPRAVARLLRSSQRPQHVINGYGPTETTTFAATFAIEAVPDGTRSIPIGRPIANTTVHILDAARREVPIGVAGEIYIGGDGVARGYWNRADLTSQRFITDPFSKAAGARLYRSGDAARWCADGTIEFLGRNDGQVKLRGFRVELGEIEAHLRCLAGVRDALVVMHNEAGQKQLIGYLVLQTGAVLEPSRVREALRVRLPDYMIPTAFVGMSALPLTANGKVDRARLPAPERLVHSTQNDAPNTSVELAVHEIWREVLKLDHIPRNANFFDIGGNSLLAVQTLARIGTRFAVRVPTALMYESPTIAAIASMLEVQQPEVSDRTLVTLRAGRSTDAPLFLVHPIGGHLLGYRHLVAALPGTRAIYGLQRPEVDSASEPRLLSVAALADLYLEQILKIQSVQAYCLCGWSFGGLVALELGTRLRALGHTVAYVGAIDTALLPDDDDAERMRLRDWQGSEVSLLLASMPAGLQQHLEGVLRLEAAADSRAGNATEHRFDKLHAANLWALYTYSPTFAASDCHYYSAIDTAAGAELASSRESLQACLKDAMRVHSIEGDHYSIVTPPRVAALARYVESDLEAALARAGNEHYA